MKRHKDISDLFRDSSRRLNEAPSGRVWRQLDSRLDARRQRRRIRRASFPLGLVAGLLIVIGLIFLLSWIGQQERANLAANAQPTTLEELPPAEGLPTARQAVEITRVYRDRASQGVREGEARQRLVVNEVK